MKKFNISRIAHSNYSQLKTLREELIIEKMKMDKYFTIFLDNNPLRDDVLDTPEWSEYHAKFKEYHILNTLLKTTDFYLKRM